MTVPSRDDAAGGRLGVLVEPDVRIPTGEQGVTLSADIYRPSTSARVPALVMVLPYRKDITGIEYDASFRWLASNGYACMLVDLRGSGASDGRRRPPLDPSEVDDAVAAIQWAAVQDWCTGNVGMWGLSYGAIMSLRAACVDLPELKAIIPIMGSVDHEADVFYPYGMPSESALVGWCGHTLMQQVLPPLNGHRSEAEQARWARRLQSESYLDDILRHPAGHHIWRERAIDVESVRVPTLCVVGWHDTVAGAMVDAFDQIKGPKKLLAGPWMHLLPQDQTVQPIDFLSYCLRWWDYWLRGIDNGVTAEPAATVFVQGDEPQWESFDSWPPGKSESVDVHAEPPVASRELTGDTSRDYDDGGYYSPDPTIGSRAGLWGVLASYGYPLDQHDDDLRGLSFTSDQLTEPLTICGQASARVEIAGGSGSKVLVVRLCDVDSAGRSTLITVGTARLDRVDGAHTVECRPTAYRVAAGNRVRLVVSDADYPRLRPSKSTGFRVVDVGLLVPRAAASIEARNIHPAPRITSELIVSSQPTWTIKRSGLGRSIEVVYGQRSEIRTPHSQHAVTMESRVVARVDSPLESAMTGYHRSRARLTTGEIVEAAVEIHVTSDVVVASVRALVDEVVTFDRSFTLNTEGSQKDGT